MPFAEAWSALRQQVSKGMKIPNWTAHHGSIGEPFMIEDVTPTTIVVNPPGAKRLQYVPAGDFEAVYSRWSDYCHRALPRKTFDPLTRYSKYIISMLHLLEKSLGGRLP